MKRPSLLWEIARIFLAILVYGSFVAWFIIVFTGGGIGNGS